VYVIKASDVPALAEAGLEWLWDNAQEIEDAYVWSGYALQFVLESLHGRGVVLTSPQFEDVAKAVEVEILGPDRREILPQLDAAAYAPGELRSLITSWGIRFEEADKAAADALGMLHEQLTALPVDSVLVVHIS
jgi:hypothetical protein